MHQDPTQTLANQHLLKNYARLPLTLVEGKGAYVTDSHGKTYLDFVGGIACLPLGHQHPKVTEAIIQQTQKILHTSNLYYHPASAELAAILAKHSGLDRVFFCNSGAEANETAIKLARKYQWRKDLQHKTQILSACHSFHGRTLGALAATARPGMHEGFSPMPGDFHYAHWEDEDAFCALINEHTAAVILEPIQGEGGVHPLKKSFLEKVRHQCDQTGALLIFDEVQCGVGRTGELFAWKYYGVKPDILTLAKGLANGIPIGAMCVSEEASIGLQPGDHGCTFGGNPVACAAALAVLETLLKDDLLVHVKHISALLFKKLQELQAKYPDTIQEVRGAGLMIGIELSSCDAYKMLNAAQDAGLLINITVGNVIRLLPAYIITEKEINKAVEVLDGVFAA